MLKKVLVVNKYHFISGGAERYFFTIMEALRRQGIDAIPFSVDYAKTVDTPYRKYFIKPIVQDGEAKMINQDPSWREKLQLARNVLWNEDAAKAIRRVIEAEKPDLAYFLNFNNHIGPSAIAECRKLGLPVIMRMSDFNLVCASNMYYRGLPCTDCKKGLHHAILNKCVHGSISKSAVAAAAGAYHRWKKVYKGVAAFIAPTMFMKKDLVELGFPEDIIYQINTFAKPRPKAEPDYDSPYILFVGRFAPYKGIDTAIQAFAKVRSRKNVTLKLVGDEADSDAARVKALAAKLGVEGITFLPFERDKEKLLGLYQKALFTLVPSENYENLPNTLLESFSCGRPVIATRLGSLPDIVIENKYGVLYEFGNVEDFAEKIQWMIDHPEEREIMGDGVYAALQTDYSEEQHLQKLLAVFESVVHGGASSSLVQNFQTVS